MSRRQNYEIPGVDHGSAPIPMAARVGNAFHSSGIMGKDPATNTLPEDGAARRQHLAVVVGERRDRRVVDGLSNAARQRKRR